MSEFLDAAAAKKADDDWTMDEGLLASLFANGFMGVEVEERFGGSGASFTSMCCVIEELAKVAAAGVGFVMIQC